MIRFTSRVNVVFKMRKIHECFIFLNYIYIKFSNDHLFYISSKNVKLNIN